MAALVDPDWFALVWYGQTLDRLCREHGLSRVRAPLELPLASMPGAASGHLVAISPGALDGLDPARTVVVGGPCLGDCLRAPTLEALYDSAQPLLVARALGLPVVLYLGEREEVLGGGRPERFAALAERFEAALARLAEELEVAGLRVVRTGSAIHEQALAEVGLAENEAEGAELDRAFHLGSPPASEQDEAARAVTRRVIGAHLPEVVARHVPVPGPAPPRVLMVENLQQAGVFAVARRRAAETSGSIGFLAQLPAPSPSGAARMYRAADWDKIPARALELVLDQSPPALHPYTQQFFSCWLEGKTRAALLAAARGW